MLECRVGNLQRPIDAVAVVVKGHRGKRAPFFELRFLRKSQHPLQQLGMLEVYQDGEFGFLLDRFDALLVRRQREPACAAFNLDRRVRHAEQRVDRERDVLEPLSWAAVVFNQHEREQIVEAAGHQGLAVAVDVAMTGVAFDMDRGCLASDCGGNQGDDVMRRRGELVGCQLLAGPREVDAKTAGEIDLAPRAQVAQQIVFH